MIKHKIVSVVSTGLNIEFAEGMTWFTKHCWEVGRAAYRICGGIGRCGLERFRFVLFGVSDELSDLLSKHVCPLLWFGWARVSD